MIRGNVEREVVAGEDWDAWTAAGLVVGEDRTAVLEKFPEGQKIINICPGWLLEYSWALAEAAQLDGQKDPMSPLQSRLVSAVQARIKEAFGAMGAVMEFSIR
jgi:hypothetical protein